MVDVATVSALLSSIKTATEIAQGIRTADKAMEVAELKYQIADLLYSLADIKIAAATLSEIIAEKEKEIAVLRDALALKETIVRVLDVYFKVGDDGAPTGSPFCPMCWETKGQLVHLTSSITSFRHMVCNSCSSSYQASKCRIPEEKDVE